VYKKQQILSPHIYYVVVLIYDQIYFNVYQYIFVQFLIQNLDYFLAVFPYTHYH